MGDGETGGRGDAEMGRRGDGEDGEDGMASRVGITEIFPGDDFSVSPRLPVPVSPRPRVSRPRVFRPRGSLSPGHRVAPQRVPNE